MNMDDVVLGMEVVVPRYGVGRVERFENIFPFVTIGVKPYVAGYTMDFDPANVKPWVPPEARFLLNPDEGYERGLKTKLAAANERTDDLITAQVDVQAKLTAAEKEMYRLEGYLCTHYGDAYTGWREHKRIIDAAKEDRDE